MAGKKESKTLVVGIRFPRDLYRWIQGEAKKRGLTASAVIRCRLLQEKAEARA